MLQWSGVYIHHDVYFGQDAACTTLVASGIADSNYFVGPLDTSATYFWRIVGTRADSTRDTSEIRSFNVGNPTLHCYQFIPSADSLGFDTELNSSHVEIGKRIDLAKSALIVIDFWVFNSLAADNTAELVRLARRHNIPVIYCLYGGTLNQRLRQLPWEIVHDDPLDSYLRERGITTLIYAGFGSGACVTLSRPNSINTITMRNPGEFDIVFIKDCTDGLPIQHLWNVNGIETRWQTSTLSDMATALGDNAVVTPPNIPFPVVDLLPLNSSFGRDLDYTKTALLLVNIRQHHNNDGWAERIRRNARTKVSRLLSFARTNNVTIIHAPMGEEIDSSCTPAPGELIVQTRAELWSFLHFGHYKTLIVAGNFDNEMNSMFPLIDGWGLGFEGGLYLGQWWREDQGTSVFMQDCITGFEAPETFADKLITRGFIERQITSPSTGIIGDINFATTLDILHTNTNGRPVFLPVSSASATEDSTFRIIVHAIDPDNSTFRDTVKYGFILRPTWLSMDSLTGELTGIPQGAHINDTVVAVQAYDGFGGFDTLSFSIHIQHTNHPPAFLTFEDTVATEHAQYTGHAIAIDRDSPLFGDSVRYSLRVSPSWLSIDPVTGALTGVPPEGARDTVLIIMATDGMLADTLIARLTVIPINDPPVLRSIPSIVFAEDDSTLMRKEELQTWVSDPDDSLDALQWHFAGHIVSIRHIPDEGYVLNAPPDWFGDDTVTVVVSDPEGLSDTARVPVTVTPVNDAPRITSIRALTFDEDATLLVRLNSLVYDVDDAFDSLQFTVTCGNSNILAAVVDSMLSLHASPNYNGQGTVYLSATDPFGMTTVDTLAVVVLSVNDPPVFGHLAGLVMDEDDSLVVVPSGWCPVVVDPDNLCEDFTWDVQSSEHITVLHDGERCILRPHRDWFGDDSLMVVVSDEGGLSDTGYVRIIVLPVNDPPVVSGIPPIVFDEDSSITLFLDPFVHDVDDSVSSMRWDVTFVEEPVTALHREKLMYRKGSGRLVLTRYSPGGLSDSVIVSVDSMQRTVTFRSTYHYWNEHLRFVFTATDPWGASGIDTVTVSISPVNNPPVLSAIPPLMFAEDDSTVVPYDFLCRFVEDPDDPASELSWQFFNGTSVYHHTIQGGILVRALTDWFGRDTLRVIVADPHGLSDTGYVPIVVTSVNDAPVVSGIPDIVFMEDSSFSVSLDEYVRDVDDPVESLHWEITFGLSLPPTAWDSNLLQKPSARRERMERGNRQEITGRSKRFVLSSRNDGSDLDSIVVVIDTVSRVATFSSRNGFWTDDLSCSFIATDPHGAQGDQVIHIAILQANRPPHILGIPPVTFAEDDSAHIDFTGWYQYVVDPNDSISTLSWHVESGISVTAHPWPGGITLTAPRGWHGNDTLRVVVRDPKGLADTARVFVNVLRTFHPPRIISKPDTVVGAFFVYAVHIYDPDPEDSIFQYTIYGPSWLSIDSTGLVSGSPEAPGMYPVKIVVQDQTLLADSQMFVLSVLSVLSTKSDNEPLVFSLSQNFPNPFNPVTHFQFSTAEPRLTVLKVYDLLGREVATLVEEVKQPGRYHVAWDASGLASGMYLFRLHSGSFVETKRLILLK